MSIIGSVIDRAKQWLSTKPQKEWTPPRPVTMIAPEVFREIRALKDRADFMGRLLEDDFTGESGFTRGLDGTDYWGSVSQVGGYGGMFNYRTALAQCLFRPSYGSAFYINEAMYRIIRARSRAFCSINPYWHGVMHNLRTYVIGKGHNWMAVWRRPNKTGPDKMLAAVQADLDEFQANGFRGGYRKCQKETIERKSRDGEAIRKYVTKDSRLRLQFIEPLLLWNPPAKTESQGCWFGIQYAKNDYENPLGYYFRHTNYLGADYGGKLDDQWNRMVPATEIQHVKVNVDAGTPRGIPDTYWVQDRIEQALKTLRSAGLLVQIRSKVAMIRKRVNALAGAVQPMLSAQSGQTIAGPGGTPRSITEWPDASVFDVSDQSDYSFPSQNLEIKETVSAIHAELQSAASSMGLADYMVSGTLGQGSSYATSMVAEGPVVKTMEDYQQDTIDEDTEVTDRVIDTGIEYGRYDAEAKSLIKVEMSGPPLARISTQEAQTMQIEYQCGVLSKTTWQQLRGYDPEREAANFADEAEDEAKQQADLAKKYPMPMPAVNGNGAAKNGAANNGTKQPRNKQGASARPFGPDQEPRQIQRESGGTKEEERTEELFEQFMRSRLTEGSHDYRTQERPTKEDIKMAARILSDEWKERTKREIRALPYFTTSPKLEGTRIQVQPGVEGVYLGYVDGQKVCAVDPDAIMLKYDCADFCVAGNPEKWGGIVPADHIYIDWSYNPLDAAHDCLHERIETVLMDHGWSYPRAHRYANWGPGCEMDWLKILRPELAAIAGTGETEQTDKDQTT
jgi:hypothetical protein